MPQQTTTWAGLGHLLARRLAPSRLHVLLFWLAAAACFLAMAASLPRDPLILYDSRRFLPYVDYLPPGYHLFLTAYQQLTGGLAWLAQVQLGLLFVGVGLLAQAAGALSRNMLAAYGVAFLGIAFPPSRPYTAVMSDALFAALMAAGAACFLFYVLRSRQVLLWTASALFGLAAAVRSIGEVLPLAMALGLVLPLMQRRLKPGAALAALTPFAVPLLAAAAFTWCNTGEFKIGSTGGVSIFGKGLMVAAPLPPEHPMSAFNWIPEQVRPAQEAVARAPDPVVATLMTRQYYEYLRWRVVFPAMGEHEPAWRDMDFGEQSAFVGKIAKAYIEQRPGAYARLVLQDYASLWALPHHLTRRERTFLAKRFLAMPPAPYLEDRAAETANDYHSLVGNNLPRADVWIDRLASAAAFVASAAVGLMLLFSGCARASTTGPAVLFLCAAVHGSFLGTALFESGLERYAAPAWPLILALLALTPKFLRESLQASRSSPRGPAPARA